MTIVFDIETVPAPIDDASLAWLMEKAQKAERDLDEYAALCPPLASVLAIGFKVDEKETQARYVGDGGKASETELLRGFFQAFGNAARYITFNGRGFDFPVLLNRAAALGIVVPAGIKAAALEYRYKPDRHIDVLELVTQFGAGTRYPLAAYAVGYGIPYRFDNGGTMLELTEQKNFYAITQHVINDVDVTAALCDRWCHIVGQPDTRKGTDAT